MTIVVPLQFWVIYITLVFEGLICIHACHSSPHGVRCTWRGLWAQLCYRRPRLPRAVARRKS